jgi:23S rRNA pseudouridine1911/1915/1917 synthase
MAETTDNNQLEYNFTAVEAEQGVRLDIALAQRLPEYSRSCLQIWIRQGYVQVNGRVCKPREPLQAQQNISIKAPISTITKDKPQDIALDIIDEDEQLIIINKPAGMTVHPGAGNPDNTLLNALLHHHNELEQLPRAGIIHRLDKDTSGLLVVPKTLTSHRMLSQQLQTHQMERHYLTIVKGRLISGGTINAAIGRHRTKRTLMAVVDTGKPATSHYRIQERFGHHSLLKFMLETGRTHQIRVHCQSINHPIIGDQTYGKRPSLPKGASSELIEALQGFKRQALHAYRIELTHPTSLTKMHWQAPLPDDFTQLLETIRTYDPDDSTQT